MNAPVLQYVYSSAPAPRYRELDCVRLVRDMATEETSLVPAGTIGTVVGVWPEGHTFELEFAEYEGLVTASVEDVEHVQGG